jgi:NAD(P)H-nitrite reductase large subunit
MRTSDPNIWAVGDVAEHQGQIYGLWPSAVEQGEVAAINAVGGDKVYEGTVPVTILKVVGIELASMGRFEPESEDEAVIALEDIEEHRYRKLVISHSKISGAILLGYPLDAPAVTAAIKQQVDVTPCLEALRAGDWSALSKLVQ